MQSFEDYHAVKNRQRMKMEAEQEASLTDEIDDAQETTNQVSKTIASKLNAGKPLGGDVKKDDVFCMPAEEERSGNSEPDVSAAKAKANDKGKLMELFEVQLLVLTCIGLDIFFSVLELVMTYNDTSSLLPLNAHMSLLRVIQSFTGFTMFFFLLEIITLMVTFKEVS